MTWRAPIAAALLVLACKDPPPPPAPTPLPPMVVEVSEIPRSYLEACTPIAAALEERTSGTAEPLPASAMPRPLGPGDDPATVRLQALEAVDELRARLRRSPKHPGLHLQLAQVYGDVLGNRTARLQHLCRALLSAPGDAAIAETVLAAWMEPGAELELEVALRPGDRSLPWRAALDAVRAGPPGDGRARARRFEESLRAQRVVRNGALLRRERARARVEPGVITAWARGAELRVVASIRSKDRTAVERWAAKAPEGVSITPGFSGKVLLHAHDPAVLFAALAEVVPGRRVFVVARAGDAQLVLSADVRAATPARAQDDARADAPPPLGPHLAVQAFGASPEDPTLRATLMAGGSTTRRP